MLKQLTQLTVAADGRYATADELQFISDYLATAEQRISAYVKVRNAASDIIDTFAAERRSQYPNAFQIGGKDVSGFALRDMTNVLRCCAAAALINDLDRLQEAVLLWLQSIAKSFGWRQHAEIDYGMLQEIIKTYLTDEEAQMILPAIKLAQTTLSL
jgi:hypothetical protein